MRAPVALILAALAALLCAASASAHSLPLRSDGRIPAGFNGSYPLTQIWSDPAGAAPWVDAYTAAERAAGASVSRMPLYWDGVEPIRGSRTWVTYDRIVRSDWFQGLRPILLISGAPRWAAGGCTSTCVPDAAHLADFQGFVQAVVARYGALIAGVEIFNEPNLALHWGSAADPGAYARVLCAGFRGERAAEAAGAAHVPVAGGAVSDNQTTAGGDLSLSDFLTQMFAAGAARCMDALSFHDYPGSANLGLHFTTALWQVRAARDAAAPGLPLWLTETGLSLSQPGITEDVRAAVLPNVYRAMAAQPDVDVVIFHTPAQSSDGLSFALGWIGADAAGNPRFNPTATYTALQSELAPGR